MKEIIKKPFEIIKICEKVSKISIYILVFLMPIFFLPWTANILDFNKQTLLIVLVLISLFSWMLKVLISGKINLNISWVHIPIAILFLVSLASTIFSLWPYGSFWGWPQLTSECLLTLIGLAALYFLVSNIFSKREIFYLMVLLFVSAFLSVIYGIFQLFGKFLIPFDFTKTTSFNTVGSVSDLAVFTAILIPLNIIFLIISQKWLKVFFMTALAVFAIFLIIINFKLCWWIIIAAAVLIITFGMQKRDFFDTKWLVLPMFFLTIALFCILFRFQIPGLSIKTTEVFLDQQTSFDISLKTLKEKPILGSGPGTFIYDFSKYKKIDFNQSSFWDLRFEKSSSKILDTLATTGILGALSFLGLVVIFIFYGIKFLFQKIGAVNEGNNIGRLRKKVGKILTKSEEGTGRLNEGFFWMLGMGIFSSFVVLSAVYFFYQSNLVFEFIQFLLMASFISLFSYSKKEILLKASSSAIGLTFALTLVFIFGLGIFILEGQRYAAEASYFEGAKAWQQARTDDAINYFEKAARINPQVDLYWRDLSQVYLRKINEVFQNKDLSSEESSRQIQSLISASVDSVSTAAKTSPKNVANWSVRGFIYQSLVGIVSGTKDWAAKSYEEALNLEPVNPYFPTQIGIAFIREASFLDLDQKREEREKILGEAEAQFERAIGMKSDYAPARFQLAMVYQTQGKQVEAIQELERTKEIAPFDVGLAFQLGLIYYQNKEYQKARDEFEGAVLLNPDYSNALYFLGLTYYELGQKEKAIEKVKRVVALNPDSAEARQVLENLKVGKKPLEGIIEQVPPTVPIKERSPEIEGE